MSTFGETVAFWRLCDGVQQKQLAASLGISAQYLNDIEHDRRNPPGDELIERLASVLTCPPHYLFYKANRIPPDMRGADVLVSTIMVAFARFHETLAEELDNATPTQTRPNTP